MSGAEQLSFEKDSGLPPAFADRWRELGGGSISGESCTLAHGSWWLIVSVAGAGKFAMLNRDDLRACADELFARCAS